MKPTYLVSWRTYQYSLPRSSSPSCGSALRFREGSRQVRFIPTWSPPLPSVPPIRVFFLLGFPIRVRRTWQSRGPSPPPLLQGLKSPWGTVSRRLLADCGTSLTRGHGGTWCRCKWSLGSSSMLNDSSRDIVYQRSIWSRTQRNTWPLITSCCFWPCVFGSAPP